MDKYLYLAMNGAAQAMLAQQNNANNLANISTTGFKANLDHFEANLVYGPGYSDRVYVTEPSTATAGLRCRPPTAVSAIPDAAI
jgi:flagellar basal-body rod protein FlgF